MTKIDLKRTEKYAFRIYAGAVLLFTAGAWDRIAQSTVLGIRFLWLYPAIVLLAALVLYLYIGRMKRRQKVCGPVFPADHAQIPLPDRTAGAAGFQDQV